MKSKIYVKRFFTYTIYSIKTYRQKKLLDSKKSAIGDSKWQASADPSKWPSYEIYPATMWNYGLVLNNTPLNQQFEIIKKAWPSDNYPFTPIASPIVENLNLTQPFTKERARKLNGGY